MTRNMFIKKRRIYFLFFITGFFLAWAVGASGFEIVDVQTTGDGGAYDECVRIRNGGSTPISLLDFKLEGLRGADWVSRSGEGLPDISVGADEIIILASSLYSGTDEIWRHTARWGFSDSSGGVRLLDANEIVVAEKYWEILEEIEPEPEYIPEPTPKSDKSTTELNTEFNTEFFEEIESTPDYSSFQITISEFMPDPVGSEVRRTITR